MPKNNIILDLSESYKTEIMEFISWYKTKRFGQLINSFVSNDTSGQISTIMQYTSEVYNLTIAFNSNVYMISYFNSKIAKDEIVANYNKTKEVTDIVFINSMNKNKDYITMATYAIYKLFFIIRERKENGIYK